MSLTKERGRGFWTEATQFTEDQVGEDGNPLIEDDSAAKETELEAGRVAKKKGKEIAKSSRKKSSRRAEAALESPTKSPTNVQEPSDDALAMIPTETPASDVALKKRNLPMEMHRSMNLGPRKGRRPKPRISMVFPIDR